MYSCATDVDFVSFYVLSIELILEELSRQCGIIFLLLLCTSEWATSRLQLQYHLGLYNQLLYWKIKTLLQNQQSIGRDFNIVSSHVTVNVKSKPLVNILSSSVTLSEPFIRAPDYSFPSQTKKWKDADVFIIWSYLDINCITLNI